MKAVNYSSKTEFNSYINFYDGKNDENFSIMLRSIVRMLFTPAQFIRISHKDIKFCERTKLLLSQSSLSMFGKFLYALFLRLWLQMND